MWLVAWTGPPARMGIIWYLGSNTWSYDKNGDLLSPPPQWYSEFPDYPPPPMWMSEVGPSGVCGEVGPS